MRGPKIGLTIRTVKAHKGGSKNKTRALLNVQNEIHKLREEIIELGEIPANALNIDELRARVKELRAANQQKYYRHGKGVARGHSTMSGFLPVRKSAVKGHRSRTKTAAKPGVHWKNANGDPLTTVREVSRYLKPENN